MTSTGLRGHRRAIAAVLLGLAASACAPAAPPQDLFSLTWGKLGMGYEAFVDTRNDCVQAASVVTENAAGRERAMPAVSASRFKSCMGARGWEAVPGGYSAPLGYNVRVVE
jgi:hypothetical protein